MTPLDSSRACLLAALAAMCLLWTGVDSTTGIAQEKGQAGKSSPSVVDDASRLNRTNVAEILKVPADPAEAEQQLREVLRRARAKRLKVSIAGAGHSMGGHTIYPGGIVLNML